MDFLSFRVSINSYRWACSTQHFHKYWTLFSSDDNNTWIQIHNNSYDEEPSGDTNDFHLLSTSIPSRFIKIYTNSPRFTQVDWALTISRFYLFGSVSFRFSMCTNENKVDRTIVFIYILFMESGIL